MSKNLISTNIEKYLKEHENKELLRFITCGSVDDGKSTLIGRLLYDSKTVLEDQLSAVKRESRKYGTTNEEIDFALLIDGLQSEREQGITIDVAYRFFATDRRKYIIADTPGHEQYTRNMVTGASTANLAVILIDARKGVLTQTRRHSYIVSLLGIRHIVVAINKMDIVGYSEDVYKSIKEEYLKMFEKLSESLQYAQNGKSGYHKPTVDFIPISALKGDNVVQKSTNMQWYEGKPLLEYLDTIEISKDINLSDFRFPVQYVNRPNLDFRGFTGTITSGRIRVGEEITVLPSGKKSRIKEIVLPSLESGSELVTTPEAFAPMAVTLTLEDEIDISRGDLIVHSNNSLTTSDSIEAMIVWMDEKALELGREYEIKRATTSLNAIFEEIAFKKDVNSWEEIKTDTLELNEIGKCRLLLTRPIACDPYSKIKGTGSFIVIDKITNHTVAAGMILDAAKRERKKRVYTEAEIELNRYIRKHFPEWGCANIEEIK
ncbi:sulfate adenylyltransferase subunit CysN [Nitrosophilus alvini]|uniref:sulfate adenylyltransferase subunit CysN n=1 Tax=Nitrosophilus alvini TaxID=2714855 RepID=UPI00190A4722|nr:sulfate adenylyltransferase subunit CysN [Nitrosophilus alvini]